MHKKKGIKYNLEQKDRHIFLELLARFNEGVDSDIKLFWNDFNQKRKAIIKDTIKNPKELIRWLYEQQGERRFDSANRLFLVLIDENDLENSWRMKRNTSLLKNAIQQYLDYFDAKDIERLKITFNWKDGKQYSVLSDIIFIKKE